MAEVDVSYAAPQQADGWIDDGAEPWVYVSATSFKIVGRDVTAKYTPGTRIRVNDAGSTKYFVVVSSAFGTDTTVTITGGTDYSLAGGALSANFHSYAENPQGYPGWFNYTPTFTGFSANPTVAFCRFAVVGRIFYFKYGESVLGTSNATTFTMTGFPFTAPSGQPNMPCVVSNSGATLAAPGYCQMIGTTLSFFKDLAGNAFNNTLGKGANVNVHWQI